MLHTEEMFFTYNCLCGVFEYAVQNCTAVSSSLFDSVDVALSASVAVICVPIAVAALPIVAS